MINISISKITKHNKEILKGLYGISDNKLTPHNTIFKQLQMAIDGGLRIFQYRDKISSDDNIQSLVKELQDFCSSQNILFILNDRYKLAIKLNLSGLHLGKDEIINFDSIRNDFKGIIGVSCYNDISMAYDFSQRGADYVAFGSMFESKTKQNAIKCPLNILQEAKKIIQIPICAIGGITRYNVHLLECDMIAVISSLWETNTITDNAKNLINSRLL